MQWILIIIIFAAYGFWPAVLTYLALVVFNGASSLFAGTGLSSPKE